MHHRAERPAATRVGEVELRDALKPHVGGHRGPVVSAVGRAIQDSSGGRPSVARVRESPRERGGRDGVGQGCGTAPRHPSIVRDVESGGQLLPWQREPDREDAVPRREKPRRGNKGLAGAEGRLKSTWTQASCGSAMGEGSRAKRSGSKIASSSRAVMAVPGGTRPTLAARAPTTHVEGRPDSRSGPRPTAP